MYMNIIFAPFTQNTLYSVNGTQDLVCASKRSTMSYILVPQLACKKEINLFIWNIIPFLLKYRHVI